MNFCSIYMIFLGYAYVDKRVIKCQRGNLWGSWLIYRLGFRISSDRSEESLENSGVWARMEENNSGR